MYTVPLPICTCLCSVYPNYLQAGIRKQVAHIETMKMNDYTFSFGIQFIDGGRPFPFASSCVQGVDEKTCRFKAVYAFQSSDRESD